MSGAGGEQAMSSARDITAQASHWVAERHLPENWNEEMQGSLDAWLAESPAHLVAFLRLDAAWNRTQRLAALRRPLDDADQSVKGKGRFALGFAWMIAGCLGFAVIGAGAFFLFANAGEKIYATPVGGHAMVTLADGSQIELNTDTLIRVADNPSRRDVTLEKGEAYFQIRHDAAHPFTLTVAGHRVIDLGTKFLVRDDNDRLEVALMEGRIKLQSPDVSRQMRGLVLAPGDVAVATADKLVLTKKSAPRLQRELGWRSGMLVFRHVTLADAAEEFNRYNREKLIVADNAAARLTIDGTFRTIDVDAFVDVAQDTLRLRVERRGDETIISR
jgi:transmembrane sensor